MNWPSSLWYWSVSYQITIWTKKRTHLYHTSFRYLSITCNALIACYIRRETYPDLELLITPIKGCSQLRINALITAAQFFFNAKSRTYIWIISSINFLQNGGDAKIFIQKIQNLFYTFRLIHNLKNIWFAKLIKNYRQTDKQKIYLHSVEWFFQVISFLGDMR